MAWRKYNGLLVGVLLNGSFRGMNPTEATESKTPICGLSVQVRPSRNVRGQAYEVNVYVDRERLFEVKARLPSLGAVILVELVGELDLRNVVSWKKADFVDHSYAESQSLAYNLSFPKTYRPDILQCMHPERSRTSRSCRPRGKLA